jgi:hypothetical protein
VELALCVLVRGGDVDAAPCCDVLMPIPIAILELEYGEDPDES